jgi:hypothetical protein
LSHHRTVRCDRGRYNEGGWSPGTCGAKITLASAQTCGGRNLGSNLIGAASEERDQVSRSAPNLAPDVLLKGICRRCGRPTNRRRSLPMLFPVSKNWERKTYERPAAQRLHELVRSVCVSARTLRRRTYRRIHVRPARSIFSNALNFCRSATAALLRSPWRYFPLRLPNGAPLPGAPPWKRHRPFIVAGARQGSPLLLRAPHRRAFRNCSGC